MKAVVSHRLFAIAAKFASEDETRYILNGVNIRPHPVKGAVLTATDGRCLGSVYDEQAIVEGEVTVKADKRLLSTAPLYKDGTTEKVLFVTWSAGESSNDHKGEAYVTSAPMSSKPYAYYEPTRFALAFMPDAVICGTYPDYHHVMPKPTDTLIEPSEITINLDLLAKFKIGKCDQSTTVKQVGTDGALIITIEGRSEFFGLLMPMRNDRKLNQSWLTDFLKSVRTPEVKQPVAPAAPVATTTATTTEGETHNAP